MRGEPCFYRRNVEAAFNGTSQHFRHPMSVCFHPSVFELVIVGAGIENGSGGIKHKGKLGEPVLIVKGQPQLGAGLQGFQGQVFHIRFHDLVQIRRGCPVAAENTAQGIAGLNFVVLGAGV